MSSSGATLAWTAVAGATSYNVQYRVSGTSAWTSTTGTGTSKALTGLAAGTAYEFQVQTVCASGSSAFSASATFTTARGQHARYCASKGNSVAYEYLAQVALGSIDRRSGADGGYYSATSLNTSVAQGSAPAITYKVGFSYSAYTENVKVYADWNQNGSFADAGELVVSGHHRYRERANGVLHGAGHGHGRHHPPAGGDERQLRHHQLRCLRLRRNRGLLPDRDRELVCPPGRGCGRSRSQPRRPRALPCTPTRPPTTCACCCPPPPPA